MPVLRTGIVFFEQAMATAGLKFGFVSGLRSCYHWAATGLGAQQGEFGS